MKVLVFGWGVVCFYFTWLSLHFSYCVVWPLFMVYTCIFLIILILRAYKLTHSFTYNTTKPCETAQNCYLSNVLHPKQQFRSHLGRLENSKLFSHKKLFSPSNSNPHWSMVSIFQNLNVPSMDTIWAKYHFWICCSYWDPRKKKNWATYMFLDVFHIFSP